MSVIGINLFHRMHNYLRQHLALGSRPNKKSGKVSLKPTFPPQNQAIIKSVFIIQPKAAPNGSFQHLIAF